MHPNDSLLNDYVDDALEADDQRQVDEHLGDCGRCRTLVAELRDLRHAAANLPQVAPSPRVWSRIERELRESSIASHPSTVTSRQSTMSRRRLHLLDWRLVLAPVAAVLLLTAWVGYRLAERQAVPQPTASLATPSAQSVEAELEQAEEHYQKAITGLERIASADQNALDPRTTATLQKNLAVIDQAISESRAALRTQPESEPAQASLLESFKAKISLLQDTVALINEMRKGNDAGAAQIASGLKRGT